MQREKYVVPEIREAPGRKASPAGDGRVACFLDQSREVEGRKESPESITGQMPEEVVPEAAANHEEVRATPLDDEGVSCPVAYATRDNVELLRVLFEREVSAETY